VKIEWIDRVCSTRYQTTNVTASSAPKMRVLASSGRPRLSVRLSVTKVPKTLTSATVNQYRAGM